MEGRLAAALEDCRVRLARGESIEACLQAHPAEAEQLAPLLPLVAELLALRQEADPAFANAARRRFHAHLAQARPRRASWRESALGRLRRLALPLATVLALGASGVGLVQASADALPGSPLYPVQQAHERLSEQLAARTPAQSALYHYQLASKRLGQIQRAEALHAGPAVVDQLTAGMVRNTTLATQEVAGLGEPFRARGIARLAPLLAQEDRLLAQQERGGAPRVAHNAAPRRRQLGQDAALLHLPPLSAASPQAAREAGVQRVPAATPKPGPTPTPRSAAMAAPAFPPAAAVVRAVVAHPAATVRPSPNASRPAVAATATPARHRRHLPHLLRRISRPVHPPSP